MLSLKNVKSMLIGQAVGDALRNAGVWKLATTGGNLV